MSRLIFVRRKIVGSSFAPSDIASLKAWYKSDAGVTKDGSDLVSQWNDQTANALHLTEATNQPLWVSSLINGYPAIRFDGTNDRLINTTNTSLTGPIHVFMVVNQVSYTTNDCLLIFENDSTANPRIIQSSSTELNYVATATGTSVTGPAAGTFGLVTVLFKTGAGNSSIAINNNAPTTDADSMTIASDGWTVGGRFSSAFANIEVAEICIFDGEVSGSDLTNLKSYFQTRYALW